MTGTWHGLPVQESDSDWGCDRRRFDALVPADNGCPHFGLSIWLALPCWRSVCTSKR